MVGTPVLQLMSLAGLAAVILHPAALLAQTSFSTFAVVSRVVSSNQPPSYGSLYVERTGLRLLGRNQVSADNGRTWSRLAPIPDFTSGLPEGYRREPVTSAFDPLTARLLTVVNALDTPGLDPRTHEPPLAQRNYYLRYRVSEDGGRTFLFDEPIMRTGRIDARNPIEGVWVGTNAIYLGDVGCLPLFTPSGHVLLAAQTTPVGADGKLYNPMGGHTYTEVVVLIGTWTDPGRLKWAVSQRVRGDPARTTRGLIEPTLSEFSDGRILMVMRGSNGGKADPSHRLPSYKWFSISKDGGQTWNEPAPWTYDDGRPFFSPSSMSTLFAHSSGRRLWVGNLSPTNCAGDLPRWPLVIGEVDSKTLLLVRETILTVDTHQPEDNAQGRLDISHATLYEDRKTGEVGLTYPRAHNSYKSREWVIVRIGLRKRLGK
jgi:hypothetical protein